MRQKETFLRKRNKELRGCFVGKLESSQHFFYYHLLRNREAEKKKGTGGEWVSNKHGFTKNKDLRARAGRKLRNFSLQKSFSTEKPKTKKRKNLKL